MYPCVEVSRGTESTSAPGSRQQPKQVCVQLSLSSSLFSVLSPVSQSPCSLVTWKRKREGERDRQRQRDGEMEKGKTKRNGEDRKDGEGTRKEGKGKERGRKREGREGEWGKGVGGEGKAKERQGFVWSDMLGSWRVRQSSMHCYAADLLCALKMLALLINLQKEATSTMPSRALPNTQPSRHTLKGTVTAPGAPMGPCPPIG